MPQNSPVSIALDKNRNVILSWEQRELQDGVIISKKYRSNSPIASLDTLYGIDLSYTDNSGDFVPGTTYQVDFFRLMSDSSLVFNREPAKVSLEFEPFEDIYIYYNNRLEVSYEYSSHPQEGIIRYFDGIELLINTTTNREFPVWDTVGTISQSEFYDDFVRPDYSFKLFDLHIKLNQFIADSSGKRIILKSKSRRFYINSLENVSFEFKDELNGVVRWADNVSFADGYIIESNKIDTVYGSRVSPYEITFTDPPPIPFEVSVKPFIGNNIGEKKTTSYPIYLDIYTPEIYDFTPGENNSIEFSWRVSEENQAAGYIIEKGKLPQDYFTPIDTISADQESYKVSGLDRNSKYKFAIHSYTSEWSRAITTGYQNTLVLHQSNQLDVKGSNITYSKNGKYMAKLVPREFSNGYEYIFIKDLDTNDEYTLEIPRERDDWRAVFDGFVISEKNNTLIFLWDRDYVDVAYDYISVYDFINKEFIIENKPRPGYGGNKLELLNDDEKVVLSSPEGFTIFDTKQNQIVRQISSDLNYDAILRPHKNTAINCSGSGIFEYDLTSGEILNQSTEICVSGNINESSNQLTFYDANEIKVLDLDTYSIIRTINDSRIDSDDPIFNFWYFREDDLLIYPSHSGIYNGYEVSNEKRFAFTIPSYTENRLTGHIERIERKPDGTYLVVTFDGEFSFSFEESWSLIDKERWTN